MWGLVLMLALLSHEALAEAQQTHTQGRFAMTMPATWKKQTARSGWKFTAPREPGVRYRPNILVISQHTSLSVDAWIDSMTPAVRQEFGQVDGARQHINLNGEHAVVFEARLSRGYYQSRQYFLVHEGTGYVILCAATAADFPRYRPTFERIVSTFYVF